MEVGSLDRLNTIMQSLNDWTEELTFQGYPVAACLLAMANLELRMKKHDISESEFNALCVALEINRVTASAELKQTYPRRELRPTTSHAGRSVDSSNRQAQHQPAASTNFIREPDFQ